MAILLLAPHPAGAVISNGANAIDALGQYDDSTSAPSPIYTKSAANNGPNQYGYNTSGTFNDVVLDSTNDRLYTIDTNNQRVLVYNLNGNDTLPDRIPDNVLGASNFYTSSSSTSQSTVGSSPVGLAIDSTNNRLFVAASSSHRVMVYDVASITNGENAVNVLGQSSFTASSAATTQSGLNSPRDVLYDGTNNRLYVSEGSNNRVVVYDVASITNGENAVNVLGQANFTSASAASTQTGMNVPIGMALDSTNNRLFVAQSTGNSVTVYDVASITDGENAVNVLGQADFTASSAATTQAGMNSPRAVAHDSANNRLFVAQYTAHRVTVYDVATITDGENATNVLGQSSFTAGSAANSQTGLNGAPGLQYDSTNTRLYVAEGANRIKVFDVASITDGENAVDLLGHYDDSTSAPSPVYTKGSGSNNGPNQYGLNLSGGIPFTTMDRTNNRLFVSDPNNNRVVVYNLSSSNTISDRIPDNVLGQSNFYSGSAAVTQSGMNLPRGLAYDSTNSRLFVADRSSSRVLVFDVTTITNGENAANVLGQSNFTSGGSANTQSRLTNPSGVEYDSTNNRLFVMDNASNRVVVYDVTTITDGENATNVLGQSSFTTSTAATTQAGLNSPRSAAFDSTNNRLFVADTTNNRVVVYDVASVTDGENAANVLGQADFTSASAGITQTTLNVPNNVAYDNTYRRLFVGDTNNNRVLAFDVSSITDGENAMNVLGKSSFTSSSSATTQSGLSQPYGLFHESTNDRLYVSDATDNRITVYDAAPVLTGTAYSDEGSTALGSTNVSVSVDGGTAQTTTTNSSGAFSFSGITLSAGSVVTLWLDTGGGAQGVTVTVAGGDSLLSIPIYQNRLITRCDNSCSLTNTNLDTADGNGDSDITNTFSVSSGALTVASNRELFIPSSHTFAPGGNVTVDDVDINGTFTMGSNSVTVSGTWDATSGSFSSSGTVTFTSTTTETITSDADSFSSITFNGSGGTWTLSDALDVNSTLTLTAGTLDVSTSNYAITVGGNWTDTGSASFTERSGTVTFDGTGSQTLNSNEAFQNLTLNKSGGTVTLGNTLDVNGTLTLTRGALDASTSNYGITLAGSWNNPGGSFTARSGTVTLDGSDQTLTGGTTFYDFTKTTSGSTIRTLTFESGQTVTVTHTLTLKGSSDATLKLRSSSTGTQWKIDPQGTRTIEYLDVQDSRNVNDTKISASGKNIKDSGNNTAWDFSPAAPSSLKGTVKSRTSITWTWTDNADTETGFKLQDSAGKTLATIEKANTTSYTETSLAPGRTHKRRVVAYNADGTSDPSNTASVTLPKGDPPGAPSLTSPGDGVSQNTLLPLFTFGRSTDPDGPLESYALLLNPSTSQAKTLSFSDPQAGATTGITGAQVTSTSSAISVTITDRSLLGEGSHAWGVEVTDDATNTATSNTRNLTLDVTKPSLTGVTITPSASGQTADLVTANPNALLTLALTDNLGLKEVTLTFTASRFVLGEPLGPAVVRTQTLPATGTSATLVTPLPSGLSPGTATLALTVTDAAGNAIAHTRSLVLLASPPGTKAPQGYQLAELEKAAKLRREREARNLQAFLGRFISAKTLQLVDERIGALVSSATDLVRDALVDLRGRALALLGVTKEQLGHIRALATATRASPATETALASLHAGVPRLVGRVVLSGVNTRTFLEERRADRRALARATMKRVDQAVKPALRVARRAGVGVRIFSELLRGKYEEPLAITDVVVENPTPTVVTITWRTSRSTRAKFNWGETPGYGAIAGKEGGELFEDTFTTKHTLRLEGLTPGKKYYFEFASIRDVRGAEIHDAYYSFTTPSE